MEKKACLQNSYIRGIMYHFVIWGSLLHSPPPTFLMGLVFKWFGLRIQGDEKNLWKLIPEITQITTNFHTISGASVLT